MSALLRIYDDVTANKYVSLGISTVSAAFIVCKTVEVIDRINPVTFIISACAGSALALLSITYLTHNDKNEGERNNVYATLSLFTIYAPTRAGGFFDYCVIKNIKKLFQSHYFSPVCFLNGLGIGFLATNLSLQILEGKRTIKFQWPIKFS